MSAARTTVLVRITGRVQGVGYREWTRRKAGGIGLAGWVRNCPDGSVQALFDGDPAVVTDMLVACHRGPTFASVSSVTDQPAPPFDGTGFTVRETPAVCD